MSNPIYPGAVWNPGAAAGYVKGRNSVSCCKAHYTVGRDSTGIGLQGYFQFLVSRDGRVQQFAEVDALCWDSGEWNGTGPGIEIEYLDEPEIFTDASRQSCGLLVAWLVSEWGIRAGYYDSTRLPLSSGYQGFISHRSLIQSEEHYDYWPQTDWALMTATPAPVPTPPSQPRRKRMVAIQIADKAGEYALWGPGAVEPINKVEFDNFVADKSGPVITKSSAEVADLKKRVER